jgi:hypothetical protein
VGFDPDEKTGNNLAASDEAGISPLEIMNFP